jgi:hypothetical protein
VRRSLEPNLRWKLEDGKHYPVKMTLGSLTIDTEVAARPNSVSTEIKDEKFAAGLRSASALNVAGAGATIHVPLDKSELALDRLEKCVEKNNRTSRPTSFVAPARQLTAGVSEGKRQQHPLIHAITPGIDLTPPNLKQNWVPTQGVRRSGGLAAQSAPLRRARLLREAPRTLAGSAMFRPSAPIRCPKKAS